MENGRNLGKYDLVLDSIDESCADDSSNDKSISTDNLKDVWYERYVHPNINTIYARFKICDRIRQPINECKESEIFLNRMRKGLHKFFKAVVNNLNYSLITSRESGSEVSHFILELIIFRSHQITSRFQRGLAKGKLEGY